jgi:hypothetical protein
MKKLLLLCLCSFFLFAAKSYSQDIITKTDGTDISSKVLEVNTADIKYKRFDNLKGPIFTIQKSEVFSIKYENGSKDVFTKEKAASSTTAKSTSTSSPISWNPSDIGIKRFHVFAASSFPTGKFADKEDGMAKAGGGVGIEYVYPLGIPMLNLTAGTTLIYNPAKNGDFSGGYLMDWTTAGLRVQKSIDDRISLYGLTTIGFNYTSFTGDYNDNDLSIDDAFSFAYSLGIGCVFNNKFNVGLRFNKCKAKVSGDYNDNDVSYKQKIGTLQLTVGFEF